MASSALCGYISANHLAEGVRQKAALNHLLNNNGYCPNVLWHIRIVLENAEVEKHELDISFFGKTESIQPTFMLCENLEDIRFYLKQTKYYHPDSPMVVNEYHGGGGTTVDVFKVLKRRNIVCLVILDSDIKFPGCEKGETASRCVNNYQDKCTNIEVKVLPVHEAENLVPISFMLKNTDADGVRFLTRLKKKKYTEALVYYDVKEGISKEKTNEFKDYKEFAKTMYEKLYTRNKFEAYYRLIKKNALVFPKLNKDMLSLYNSNSVFGMNDELESYRKEIADLVFTFLCCRGADPIN